MNKQIREYECEGVQVKKKRKTKKKKKENFGNALGNVESQIDEQSICVTLDFEVLVQDISLEELQCLVDDVLLIRVAAGSSARNLSLNWEERDVRDNSIRLTRESVEHRVEDHC